MMTPTSLRRKPPKPPKGFFTTVEWAKKWKLSIPRTGTIIRQAEADKLVKKIRIMRLDKIGVRPCNYYAPV